MSALSGCGPSEPEGKGRGPVDEPSPPFEREALLDRQPGNQQTTNLRTAPLGWGPPAELVVTETNPPRITWVGCGPDGCDERDIPIPDGLAPVRTSTADLDGDGDNDLVVADIGELRPTNERVGALWIGWNTGDALAFEQVADDIGRACCAEPGDLDGDGDLDLTLCAFGHVSVGAMGWMEQSPTGWVSHVLEPIPGAIHAFPVDVDADGDLDIVTAYSQLDEMVRLYRNDGTGQFTGETLLDREPTWWGTSGIEPTDLDGDGDVDILVSNGDTMDGDWPAGEDQEQVHGVVWLENDGTGAFTERELARVWSAYGLRAADVDNDQDMDVVVANLQLTTAFPSYTPRPLTVLLNDGSQQFDAVDLDAGPLLVAVEVADLDQDGWLDLVTGSLEMEPNSQSVRADVHWGRGF